MSIFRKFIKKASNFGKRIAGEINQIGGKVIHTIQKGTRIGGKVLDIADQVAGKLEDIPVLNEAVGIAQPLIKDGKMIVGGVSRGLGEANKINNKIGRIAHR